MLDVHLKLPLEPALLERLRAALDPGVMLSCGEVPADADYEILVDGFPGERELRASRRLRSVIVPWAGPPLETIEMLKGFPALTLHNLPYNSAPTAELALALLLGAAKRIALHDRGFRRHIWSLPPSAGTGSVLLEGGTALVLGYGRIGQRVAAGCRGVGMRVLAMCRNPRPDAPDPTFGQEALPERLPEASALLICLPHTRQTEGMIGARELALLPPQAVLVNVARGPIVDQEALYRSLKSRSIFGAGLDVWYRYPTDAQRELRMPVSPSDFPFHELDNVVMSPHRAGWSEETEAARCTKLAELLNAAARGRAIGCRIDLQRGY